MFKKGKKARCSLQWATMLRKEGQINVEATIKRWASNMGALSLSLKKSLKRKSTSQIEAANRKIRLHSKKRLNVTSNRNLANLWKNKLRYSRKRKSSESLNSRRFTLQIQCLCGIFFVKMFLLTNDHFLIFYIFLQFYLIFYLSIFIYSLISKY